MKQRLFSCLSLLALCAFTTVVKAEVKKYDYTDAIVNADLSTDAANDSKTPWNAVGTKGISGGMVKVGSGSTFDFSQTITLPAGQYKMTAKAAYRYASSEKNEYDSIKIGAKTHLAKLYATVGSETFETNVQNRWEGASDTDLAGSGAVEVNGKYVPNSSAAVQAWFNNGKYVNELVFVVPADGHVKIGIKKIDPSPTDGDYANIGAWTLTRIEDYTDAIVNADLSTDAANDSKTPWNAVGTKGISGGMVKVGSGSTFDFSQTITLPAGQYKMTAKAAYRYASSEKNEYDSIKIGAKTHLAKLYATVGSETFETNVQNRWEGASDTDLAGSGAVEVNGKYVPNSSAAVQAWFNNGKYVNELVFVVPADGHVKIGIKKIDPSPTDGDYANIGAWTLTRMGDAKEETVTMEITDAKYATFIAPFDVEIPSGVTASMITGVEENGATLIEEAVEGVIPANTPVVVYSDEPVEKVFTGYNVAAEKSYTVGLLTGVYNVRTAPVASYVLQNNDKVAFYSVVGTDLPTVFAGHCYLTLPVGAAAAPMYSLERGEGTTGIQDSPLMIQDSPFIYDLLGRRVENPTKGIYIVNGKKVVIK